VLTDSDGGTPDKLPPCIEEAPDHNSNCSTPASPIVGRIIGREADASDLLLRIGAGSDQGITKAWRAMVVSGPDPKDEAVSGGEVQIISIDKTRIRGKTKLTAGQIDANPYVKFVPAPK